jgi:hypothetical protein
VSRVVLPPADLDARGRRLRAALAAVLVRDNAPELRLMHRWLDSWCSLDLMVEGMTHQARTFSSPPTPRATGGRASSPSGSRTPSWAARRGSRRRGGRCSRRRGRLMRRTA